MWSKTGWKLAVPGHATDGPCWGAGSGQPYFDRLISGEGCDRNWYSAHPPTHVPKFHDDAPSVLGFDNDIKDYCIDLNRESRDEHSGYRPPARSRRLLNVSDEGGAVSHGRRRLGSATQECARASRTILEMADEEYNSCSNLEWQACAAMGKVPGQNP